MGCADHHGIRLVAELIDIAGRRHRPLPARSIEPLAKQRIVGDDREIIDAAPDIIIGSWCGKKFRPDRVAARPGWQGVPAVRDGELHEIKVAADPAARVGRAHRRRP